MKKKSQAGASAGHAMLVVSACALGIASVLTLTEWTLGLASLYATAALFAVAAGLSGVLAYYLLNQPQAADKFCKHFALPIISVLPKAEKRQSYTLPRTAISYAFQPYHPYYPLRSRRHFP